MPINNGFQNTTEKTPWNKKQTPNRILCTLLKVSENSIMSLCNPTQETSTYYWHFFPNVQTLCQGLAPLLSHLNISPTLEPSNSEHWARKTFSFSPVYVQIATSLPAFTSNAILCLYSTYTHTRARACCHENSKMAEPHTLALTVLTLHPYWLQVQNCCPHTSQMQNYRSLSTHMTTMISNKFVVTVATGFILSATCHGVRNVREDLHSISKKPTNIHDDQTLTCCQHKDRYSNEPEYTDHNSKQLATWKKLRKKQEVENPSCWKTSNNPREPAAPDHLVDSNHTWRPHIHLPSSFILERQSDAAGKGYARLKENYWIVCVVSIYDHSKKKKKNLNLVETIRPEWIVSMARHWISQSESSSWHRATLEQPSKLRMAHCHFFSWVQRELIQCRLSICMFSENPSEQEYF